MPKCRTYLTMCANPNNHKNNQVLPTCLSIKRTTSFESRARLRFLCCPYSLTYITRLRGKRPGRSVLNFFRKSDFLRIENRFSGDFFPFGNDKLCGFTKPTKRYRCRDLESRAEKEVYGVYQK